MEEEGKNVKGEAMGTRQGKERVLKEERRED